VTRRYLIRGRVQAVGFRNFVWRRAVSMGLSGWVRNLPDGRVEVLASGASAVLELLERELWRGPPHAQVENVEISEVLDEGQTSKTFEIKR
jgi:acylphosphatase